MAIVYDSVTADLRAKAANLSAPDRIMFLAGLPAVQRMGIPAERRAAIALCKFALLSGKVQAALGCTRAELDRLHRDGRLPHLFVHRIDVAGWGAGGAADGKV
jgi:hypothetical protein